MRLESQELDKKEGDIAVLASLCVMHSIPIALLVRVHGLLLSTSLEVCQYVKQLFINALGAHRLKNLITHYDSEGLSVRVHGNTRKRPHTQTKDEDVEKIKGLENLLIIMHSLPGRLPTHKDYRVMLLPSDMSKSAVY